MSRKILIAIDSFNREYTGIRLLEKELVKKGFTVRLCSRYVLKYAFNHFRPEIVMVHSCHKISELKDFYNQAIVVLLQAESCTGSEAGVLSFGADISSLNLPELIDLRYCWGKFDYDVIKKHPIFPNADLVITGHPITDPWYKERKKSKPHKLTIGIATSLRALTHLSGGISNPVKLINDIEDGGRTAGFYEPPYHAEAWIAFESAWIRIVLDLITGFKGYRIKLRPHPLENVEHYRFLEKKYGISVSNREDLSEWLDDVDVMLSYFSTAQLGAYIRGVNVVSIKNLFPEYLLKTLPKMLSFELDEYFFSPSSIEELKLSLQEDRSDRTKLDHFAAEMFNYPGQGRPSTLIAEHLSGYVENKLKSKSKFKRLKEGTLTNLIPDFIPKDTLMMLYRDIYGFFKRNENVSLSYCRHRFLRNRRADCALPEFNNAN